MLAQMALLPLYLWLFLGSELAEIVSIEPFVEAFALLIALPLLLAWAIQAWAKRDHRGARVQTQMLRLPVALMALTLLVVVASQVPKVEADLGRVADVIPIYAAFLVIMALVGRAATWLFRPRCGRRSLARVQRRHAELARRAAARACLA